MTKKKATKATTRDFQVSLTMKSEEATKAPTEVLEGAVTNFQISDITAAKVVRLRQQVEDLKEELAECNEDREWHKERVHEWHKESVQGREERIALLERRCQTLYHNCKETERSRQSTGQVLDGVLTLQQRGVDEITKFSLLRKAALDQVSALVGHPVAVCLACGRLSKNGGHGVSYCDECFDKTDWPWPDEAPWSKGRRTK